MKKKNTTSLIIIFAIGAVLAWAILSMEPSSVRKPSGHSPEPTVTADSVPRGKHGGWLFSADDFQIEVRIFEAGVPPEFRVYPADTAGNPIDLNEVSLTIELHRLHKVDIINFRPMRDYLLGDQTVVEPHSFNMHVKARWKDKSHEWELSQIEGRAEFTEEAIRNANITLEKTGPAKIHTTIRLSGEIDLNEEKVVHIVPRLDGVVKAVFKDLGDQVSEGEIIAVLESRELADAKINYLAATKQVNLAQADLDRALLVFENSQRMLDLLKQETDLEEVHRQLEGLLIGESRELLIPAYARLRHTQSVHLREKALFEKGISSESEYLQALEQYKSAEAKYIALREKIAYDGEWAIRQKSKTFEMEQLHLQTTTQKLLALGLTAEEVDQLSEGAGQVFTQYELRSTLNGTVIQKHMTTGEAVKKDDDIFLLADLSDVWVNIAIPLRDIQNIRTGQRVIVRDDLRKRQVKGKLNYLSSVVDEKTRTITGRVVIPNTQREWRPGSYVTVEIILKERSVPLTVLKEAIHSFRDWSVVFVRYGPYFEARPLETGESDGHRVEVLDGLSPGEVYAAGNSFAVKAEIMKSGATHSH